MTAKEKTSLYAGEIYLKMGGIVIRPSSVTIKKSLTTVTDTFSFTVPMWNDNGDVVQIPNTFGLTIDVYVNDTFYVGGILLRRIVQDNDIYCECSTHGWQLDNSDVLGEIEAETKTLGDFILTTCEQNFKNQFTVYLTDIEDQKLIPQLIEGKNFYNTVLSKIKNNESVRSPEICFSINSYKKILKVPEYTKKEIKFLLYDPYNLKNIKLSDYIVAEDKKNKIKSEYGQTVFQHIKSVTKNINVFVKCIGLYEQIKDRLDPDKLYRQMEANELNGRITYVLLLYRPGIDKDIYDSFLKESEVYQTGFSSSKLELENNKTIDIIRIRPNEKVKLYTRQYNKTIGSVFNDKTKADSCNCLEEPIEEYSAINQYTNYILLDKNKKPFIYEEEYLENDPEILKSLKKQNLIIPFYQYNQLYNLGTYKTIKVEKSLTEACVKLRLAYEVNKAKAESYKVTARVIGFTMDMNFAKAHYSENIGTNFWDFGKLVHVYSPKQMLDLYLTVEEMEMHYDSQEGAYTNLTLTYPFAYSAEELNYDEEARILQKKHELNETNEAGWFKRVWRGSWYGFKTYVEGLLGAAYVSQNLLTLNKEARLAREKAVQQRLDKSLKETASIFKTGYTSDEIKKMVKKND